MMSISNKKIPTKGDVKTTEVRDVIHGPVELYPWELAIIDSPAFQRLRNIKQLGFSEFAYPCAVHNRYVHSIGACHLSGTAFQAIFRNHFFSGQEVYHHFYYLTRAAMLLHDIGHGPFSHAIESAMPPVSDLNLPAEVVGKDTKRQASHEDYTLKIILDSSLTPVLEKAYAPFGITPWHLACVMNLSFKEKDNFFQDRGVSFRKVLHQIISSEVDADRMDYLQRDSYFSGVNYGKFDANWILTNLGVHIDKKTAHLSLNSRAIYTFEDFLLSRYHMFLMVYLHHKSVSYERMLEEYLDAPDCSFKVPSDVEEYIKCDDSLFYEHLRKDSPGNRWAERILARRTFKVGLEVHESKGDPSKSAEAMELKTKLKAKGVEFFEASSGKSLSNYMKPNLGQHVDIDENTIFVETFNQLTKESSFKPLEEFTDLFRRYGEKKYIYRIYVAQDGRH
ncbi:MAG: HD domain-containing protein [Bacteriovoracia bacterium]